MIQIYEIPKDKVQGIKKIIEAPDQATGELNVEIEKEEGKGKLEKAKAWKVNEFRKQDCKIKDAKSLGIQSENSYLYINASEDFFKNNEKTIIDAGAKKLSTQETEKIKTAIEEQENSTSSGVGFVFS